MTWIREESAQKARIDFLKWDTLIFPYIKGIHTAKKNIQRFIKEIFLMFLSGRSVIVNHSSGKVHYFEKLNRKQYLETRRELIEMIFDHIKYIRSAKKKIKDWEEKT